MKALRFTPLLKHKIWGGNRIIPFKHLNSDLSHVGESWEISGVPDNETTVACGEYAGKRLNEVVAIQQAKLVGKANYKRFGDKFPLLIKFIDASAPLSVQVHPSDEIAHKLGYESGKTEMWVVMKSDIDASLLVGLKRKITPEEYTHMVEDGTIIDALCHYSVKEGDCFFLPSGRIHAIGKGCFLCEIQQTSNVTFRIYDFKRKDENGNYRKLHKTEAAKSIDYEVLPSYRQKYQLVEDVEVPLVQCPYFKTSVYKIEKSISLDLSALDSFVIVIVIEGKGSLTDDDGNTYGVTTGDTLLFPATTKQITANGKMKFLQTYV